MEQIKTFSISENGMSMTDNKVQIPACTIKATSFVEAIEILTRFLETKIKPDEMELITPLDRIEFNAN